MAFSLQLKKWQFWVIETRKGTWLPAYCILAGTTGHQGIRTGLMVLCRKDLLGLLPGWSSKTGYLAPVFQKHFQGSYVLSLESEFTPEGSPRTRNTMLLVLWARAWNHEAPPRWKGMSRARATVLSTTRKKCMEKMLWLELNPWWIAQG